MVLEAGEEGFEPSVPGSKGRCLATWPLPNLQAKLYHTENSRAKPWPQIDWQYNFMTEEVYWRRLRVLIFGGFYALLGVVGATILFIALGFSDPKPIGALVVDQQPPNMAGWRTVSGADDSEIQWDDPEVAAQAGNADGRVLITAPEAVKTPGSIELDLQQISGMTTAGYGLWWGNSSSRYLAVAINEERYLMVTDEGIDLSQAIRPWKPFPHVRSNGAEKQLRVDFKSDQTTVWLNREVVIRLDGVKDSASIISGLFMEVPAGTTLRVRINRLQMWHFSGK
jgi:hypothetical protein